MLFEWRPGGRQKPSPFAATVLVPIVLIPGIGPGYRSHATTPYANPIISCIMVALYSALAMQRWNPAQCRNCADDVLAVGSQPAAVAGFMMPTAFLSMWGK